MSLDHYFSLGSHLNAHDVKAVRKTVSGLIKLLYPDGEVTKEEPAELLDVALEGRRRVKEQLKKMGSFEYYQTSFSYIDSDSRDERYVGVPEEGAVTWLRPIRWCPARSTSPRLTMRARWGCTGSRSEHRRGQAN